MFFHETTRRRVCRVMFLTVALAPTLGVVAWAAAKHLPGEADRIAAEMSAQWSLAVGLDDVHRPRPDVVWWDGFRIAEPETDEAILTARMIEMAERDGRQVLLVSQPEINAGRLDRLWEIVERRL